MKYSLTGLVNLVRAKAREERIGYPGAIVAVLDERGLGEPGLLVNDPRIGNDLYVDGKLTVYRVILDKCAVDSSRRRFWTRMTKKRRPVEKLTLEPVNVPAPSLPPSQPEFKF